MKPNLRGSAFIAMSLVIFFAVFFLMESGAWARAGSGGFSGSRGSRSFSSPSMPSPTYSPSSRSPGMPSQGYSPFWGGFAGGMLGSMLFGRSGYGGGGIGLLDIIVLGLLFSFVWRLFKRRGGAFYQTSGDSREYFRPESMGPAEVDRGGEVEEGLQRLLATSPGLSEDGLKEKFQDIFFRVQAAWMNRKLDGIYGMLAPEMVAYFGEEFKQMKNQGQINRLENIAIRKVEITEIWQEEGRDYVTALITANLLDYTEDEHTGQVVSGDRMNPVKFQEFWTFCRDFGSSDWQLTAINQVG